MDQIERRRPIRELRERLFRQPVVGAIGPNTRLLYIVGGVSIGLIGVLYFVGAVLSIVIGPAPSSGPDYLTALAAHPTLSRANFAVFSLVDVLLLPAALALYAALKASSRWLLLAAGACFAVNLVVDLGVTELSSFALVGDALRYTAAVSDAQRSAVLAAAEATRNALPAATLLSFVVSSIAYLLVAIGTFREVFRKAIGIVGIVGSLEGIIGGFYVIVPGLAAFLVPALVTVGLWAIFVGIRLVRIARASRSAEATPTPARQLQRPGGAGRPVA
jgi:Domain of unknown function (DUF4386)